MFITSFFATIKNLLQNAKKKFIKVKNRGEKNVKSHEI